MKKIAIITPFNDLKIFHGGSLSGIKSEISYFDQFLILYESIKRNWKRKYFNYDIYVLHSIDFSNEKKEILSKLDINLIKVNYKYHETKIRPMAYSIDIDCDFRLVLDVDMYAMKEPEFDFNYDFQAVYGGNKYNSKQWKEICEFIGCEYPDHRIKKITKGNYRHWTFKEHYLFQSQKLNKLLFPYFNNGAILIKNSLTREFYFLWEQYRAAYTKYTDLKFNINIDLEGQDVIGLALYNTSRNWNTMPVGVNFVVQEKFKEGRKLINKYANNIFLFHYINCSKDSYFFYNLLLEEYNNIISKYYEEIEK